MTQIPVAAGEVVGLDYMNEVARAHWRAPAATFNTSVAENTLLSKSIDANAMGSDRMLRVTPFIDGLNNSGGSVTFRIKVKFGATTVFDSTAVSVLTGASRGPIHLTVEGQNLATNSQVWRGTFGMATAQAFAGGSVWTTGEGSFGNIAYPTFPWLFTSAIDTTAAVTFAITVTMGTSHASAETKLYSGLVEIV